MNEYTYFEWKLTTRKDLQALTFVRDGEVKIGECVRLSSELEPTKEPIRYHLLGICEDIGPRLNGGFPGAAKAWDAFLSRFLNVQHNEFLDGSQCVIHGVIVPKSADLSPAHEYIDELDAMVSEWVNGVVRSGGIPIVIGGGHNNAYPLIKGVAEAKGAKIGVVNLDPHADVRKTGARHSGNPFSTAHENNFLKKYVVLGLHQSYNNQFILDSLRGMNAAPFFFEDWLDDPNRFWSDLQQAKEMLAAYPVGVELDMDAIAYMPSSAFTPSGVTIEQARQYIRTMARLKNVTYLHLPEAAPSTPVEEKSVGKTLAYLVTDFIKCSSNV